MRTHYEIDPKFKIRKMIDLIDEPVVILVNHFDDESVANFEEDMDDAHRTGQPIIPIVIDSFGGSSYGALGMIAAVQNAKLPVATICTSKAMSAGAALFCFGTDGYRFLDPNAVMMMHDVASMTNGKIEDIKADAVHLDRLNQNLYKRIAIHLGHKDDYFLKIIKNEHNHVDWYMTAKEAKKHRIVNHLQVPNFRVKINFDITFDW